MVELRKRSLCKLENKKQAIKIKLRREKPDTNLSYDFENKNRL